jgi:hypothetical protein
MIQRVAAWAAFVLALGAGPAAGGELKAASIGTEIAGAPVEFGAEEVAQALRERGYRIVHSFGGALDVLVWPLDAKHRQAYEAMPGAAPGEVRAEGFSLRRVSPQGTEHPLTFVVFAGDAAGAMYGGLELAEQIRAYGVEGVKDTDRNPHMLLRGTKFNAPLDLRTT